MRDFQLSQSIITRGPRTKPSLSVSGEEITVSHTWDEKGDYIIRCKAKDIHDAESDWGSLQVEMPMKKGLFAQLFSSFIEWHSTQFSIFEEISFLVR